MEYKLAIEKNEVDLYAVMWIELPDTLFSGKRTKFNTRVGTPIQINPTHKGRLLIFICSYVCKT